MIESLEFKVIQSLKAELLSCQGCFGSSFLISITSILLFSKCSFMSASEVFLSRWPAKMYHLPTVDDESLEVDDLLLPVILRIVRIDEVDGWISGLVKSICCCRLRLVTKFHGFKTGMF